MARVIIDGVEYVPIMESNPSAKQIATALIEQYMGKFDDSDFEELAKTLQVCVTEEVESPTVLEMTARIMRAINQG